MNEHPPAQAVSTLRDLGLNRLESEVYVSLLSASPMTAYAVAKTTGKPSANVYKAIESLARMGAVLVEEGDTRQCRAVPVEEFVRHAERTFLSRTAAAREALSGIEKRTWDERVYRIESVAEVFERCRAMLKRAESIVVIDAFPRSLAAITDEAEETAKRGVEVIVEAYTPTRIKGARVVVVPSGDHSIGAWRSEQLNVIVDGREHVLALMDEDLREVFQSIWSRSVYLSCLHHSGRMTEITLVRLLNASATRELPRSLRKILDEHGFFRDRQVPGQRELVRRFVEEAGR